MLNRSQTWLKSNGLYTLFLILLIMLPHIIGWLTGSSPFGTPRGTRMIMSGSSAYWMSILIDLFSVGILVMSYNLMFGFTGVVSFGHALFFGLGGYVGAMVMQQSGLPTDIAFIIGVIAALGVCAVMGIAIGFASLRLKGVYFAIFTLAVSEIGYIFFSRWSVTGGEDGFNLSNVPTWLDASQSRLNLYYLAMVLFALTFVFIRRLVNSPTGAVFKAIRENEARAQAIGFDTLRFKLLSITVAGVLAGVAGLLQALMEKKIGPEMLSVGHTVDALLMTIIGGVGTFTGPILGATGLTLADVLFRNATFTIGDTVVDVGQSWLLILGFIFVAVVLIFPYGIVGTWTLVWNRIRRK